METGMGIIGHRNGNYWAQEWELSGTGIGIIGHRNGDYWAQE